jgi:uncharacterized protein
VARARIEAQLQLKIAAVTGQRGTFFLLLGMLVWVAAGFGGAVLAAAALGFVTAVMRGLLHISTFPSPPQLAYVLVAAVGFQGTLLLVALRQGRLAGGGNRSAGLGAGPIRRPRVVALLCAATVVWLIGFILLMAAFPALRAFALSVTPDALTGMGSDGAAVAVLRVVLVMILAPVSEELFFRGWLWEALRHRGHAVLTTACLTATPWLLLHGIDSPGRILLLIPAALIFSVARHQGGGVRASLAVHMSNNGAAVMMQAVSAILGHGE